MIKYISKNIQKVDAFSFKDLIEYVKSKPNDIMLKDINIVDGIPWSFTFWGHPITHEHNECYLIPYDHKVSYNPTIRFTPNDMLIRWSDNSFGVMDKKSFSKFFKMDSCQE